MKAMSARYPASSDNTLAYIVVAAIIFFAGTYALHRYATDMYRIWTFLMLPLAKAIVWLVSSVVGQKLSWLLGTTPIQMDSLVMFMQAGDFAHWTWHGFVAMNDTLGRYFLLVVLPLEVYASVTILRITQGRSSYVQRFKSARVLDRFRLPERHLQVIGRISDDTLYDGEMSSAMSCIQYCLSRGVASLGDFKNNASVINQKNIYAILCAQLGDKYTGKKSLYASSLGWLVKLFSNRLPEDFRDEIMEETLEGHLYNTTAILALFAVAKKSAVIAAQEFIQLKIQHRPLWYALLSYGRRTVFVEGASIVAQYDYEIKHHENGADPATMQPDQVDIAVKSILQTIAAERRQLCVMDDPAFYVYKTMPGDGNE